MDALEQRFVVIQARGFEFCEEKVREPHSVRSARAGSARVARYDGTEAAIIATASRSPQAPKSFLLRT